MIAVELLLASSVTEFGILSRNATVAARQRLEKIVE